MIELLSPFTLFWLLLVGGVSILLLARWRFRYLEQLAAGISGLATLIWLLLRSGLPLEVRVSDWPSVAQLPPWNWVVDEMAWQLTGLLLLLLTGALVGAAGKAKESGQDAHGRVLDGVPSGALAIFLTLATLVSLWADSLAGVMAGWMLLLVAWAGSHLLAHRGEDGALGRLLPRTGWFLLSLFFLWLADASVPLGANFSLGMREWPQVATSSVLTAALLQMGVWPFYGWRQTSEPVHPATAVLLPVVPSIAGASLLARLVSSSDISSGYALFLTIFGLVGLLLAAQRLWLRLDSPASFIGPLALGLASVTLLSGVWAGAEALVALTTVMVLVPGLFLLAFVGGIGMPRWVRVGSSLVLLVSAAGLPLSTGFAGLGALYDSLLAEGRWLLVLVMAVLYLLVLAALLVTSWRPVTPEENAPELAHGSLQLAALARILGLALPVAGLISFNALANSPVRFGAWLALLLPVLGALALFRYTGGGQEARLAIQRAFDWHFLAALPGFVWRNWLRRFDGAVRDAAAILDGEGGMLWLLVLAVVLLVVR